MKPTSTTTRSQTKFPAIDWNYHSIALGDHNGSCTKFSPPSFRNISRDYFDIEESRQFLTEGALFATMLVSVTIPIVSGAVAILQLCRDCGAL
jgi:hypothetical protein